MSKKFTELRFEEWIEKSLLDNGYTHSFTYSNENEVCNGKRKSIGGFIWKWADDETPFDKDQPLTQKPKAKPFELFRDEVFLGKFFSMRDAEEATGIKRGQIAKARDRDGWKGITVRLVS